MVLQVEGLGFDYPECKVFAQWSMGLPAGRGETAQAALAAFVEEMKASGFVAEAMKRHGVQGAAVAPAA